MMHKRLLSDEAYYIVPGNEECKGFTMSLNVLLFVQLTVVFQ
jgi:hypothetical protein